MIHITFEKQTQGWKWLGNVNKIRLTLYILHQNNKHDNEWVLHRHASEKLKTFMWIAQRGSQGHVLLTHFFFLFFFQADGTILFSVHNLSFQVADFFFLSFIVFQRIAKNLTLNIISGCCVYCRNFTTHIFFLFREMKWDGALMTVSFARHKEWLLSWSSVK